MSDEHWHTLARVYKKHALATFSEFCRHQGMSDTSTVATMDRLALSSADVLYTRHCNGQATFSCGRTRYWFSYATGWYVR